MPDVYDVIIVGGGHNGLVASLDLANAGWSILVVEAQKNVGGCASTTEPLLPGYRHSPHANTFLFVDLMPDTISPATLGVGVNQPAAQLGIAFADGRPPVILHRPDLLDQTRASLGAYSRADAHTYTELKQRSGGLGLVLQQGLYAAPDSGWFNAQRTAVQRTFNGFCHPSKLGTNTARELIDDLFETPEVRMLMYTLATETGVALEEAGGDIAFLGYSLWIAGRWRVPHGGMQTYSDALYRAALSAGVQVSASTRVAKIIVKDRRAVAIETSTEKILGASKAVLVAAPILHLFDDLLDDHAVSQSEHDEMNMFRQASPSSIGTSFFCLDRVPHYKSAQHDSQIDSCLKTIVGYDAPSDILTQDADIRAGCLPSPAGVVRLHSLWDRSLAPAECHAVGVDSNFPAEHYLDRANWQQIESAFPTAFFETWRNYFASDPLIQPLAMSCDCSSRFERRMLLCLGPDQYRTSVVGLYLGGPGVYPGGGVHGACGHNAAQAIINDNDGRADRTQNQDEASIGGITASQN